MMQDLFNIFISSVFSKNLVFIRFLALCSFVGMTTSITNAVGMGGAVTFVTVMASIISYSLYKFVLVPLNLQYLQIIVFILTIAVFVQLVEIYLKKAIPSLYKIMGIYLPLIATNCMILAITLLNISENYNFLEATVFSLGGSVGYFIAMILLAGIRVKLSYVKIPKLFQGYPLIFIITSFITIAFMGLQGIAK